MKHTALLLLLAVPAAAVGDRAPLLDFSAFAFTVDQARSAAAVESTLTAMNDGVGAGEKVVAYLRKNGVSVVVRAQPEAVKTYIENGARVIALSASLPAYPRVYAPLIASAAAHMMYADMPASAERSYMRRATAGRVWVELGGEPRRLPVIEPQTGAMVAEIYTEIGLWAADGVQMALYKSGEAEGLSSLMDMLDAAKSPEERRVLEAANKRFTAFLLEERSVRVAAGLR